MRLSKLVGAYRDGVEMKQLRCSCNCGAAITRHKNERAHQFATRRYASAECVPRGRTHTFTPKPCKTCNQLFGRKRFPTGRLESKRDFEKRRSCALHTRRGGSRAASKSLAAVVTPPLPPQAPVAIVNRALPDPRAASWQTVASAPVENPCPEHPTERASSCTCCNLKTRHQTRKPVAPLIWR